MERGINDMTGFLLAGLLIICLILFSWIVIFAVRQGAADFLDTFIFSVLGLFLGMLCLFAKLSSSYNALINYLFTRSNLMNSFLAWLVLFLVVTALCGILQNLIGGDVNK